jgi:GNAT superfamily N-acetyltransferase
MAFLQTNKCKKIIGPMNPDIHNELGTLVNGYDIPPYFMLTHNFSYYDDYIKQEGFKKLQDFYSYIFEESRFIPSAKMERVGQVLTNKHDIQIRNPDMKKFLQELEHFHAIYNDAFRAHWGFVPIPKDEFLLLAKDMKSVIDPRMVLIVEYKNEPIAFLLCLPNLNEILIKIKNGRLLPTGIFKILTGKKKIRSLRVITAAVKQSYQHWGIGALLYPEAMKRALQCGYKKTELSWVAEDNTVMNTIARELAGDPYKTYRLYSKNID